MCASSRWRLSTHLHHLLGNDRLVHFEPVCALNQGCIRTLNLLMPVLIHVYVADGVIIRHCSTEPCSWAHMLPGNGWLLAVHQPCSLDMLMGCMERPSGPQRRTAVLWSALAHGGVAPDAGLLQALYIQPALLTPSEDQTLEQLVAMHPGLLQLTDAEGMSLAMAALVHDDEGLFSALCKVTEQWWGCGGEGRLCTLLEDAGARPCAAHTLVECVDADARHTSGFRK